MNVNEDFKFFLRKRLQSKEYQKEFNKFINSIEPIDQLNHPLYKAYIEEKETNINQSPSKNFLDKIKESNEIQLPQYSQMSKDEVDKIIQDKIMPNFKTWVQQMFQGVLVSITKCQTCER